MILEEDNMLFQGSVCITREDFDMLLDETRKYALV